MRIGYPCLNYSVNCSVHTFRLRSYSAERLRKTIRLNLDCLESVLRFNAENGILLFRISSDIVPFASHPVCGLDWEGAFRKRLKKIAELIRANRMRVCMHPDQFTLINSLDEGIFERSRRELLYHARFLDCLGLDLTAKIQIHIGGVYGDAQKSLDRFVLRYGMLESRIRRRLVIENDDRSYTLSDCLKASGRTGIPVVLDVHHHRINSSGEKLAEALALVSRTWKKRDGVPIVDFSSGVLSGTDRRHIGTIDKAGFRKFLVATMPFDFDVMLEIKDKEASALRALRIAAGDSRLLAAP